MKLIRLKYLFLLFVLMLALGLGACSPAEVVFPDPNLGAAIREAIGKPDGAIYASDLKELVA
ncbi:MAG: hypothetical protein FJ015_04495, partial [Chloroflexi bacterium]|nr:hypothetical protein [Chloroflexota bacterium]